MEEYKFRMISEKQHLDNKIEKLSKFLLDESEKLNMHTLALLRIQWNTMLSYSYILSIRIKTELTEEEEKVLYAETN